ncbi:MAG: hypothetical protein V4611_00505 [Patescibacteria group bacterium]
MDTLTEPTETPEPKETKPSNYKKELIIGSIVVVAVALIVTGIVWAINNSGPKIDYQPAVACELLTLDEAKELMGNNAVGSAVTAPVISGDISTSKCGYTDGNTDTANLIVAAINVRSAINDKGVEQNKTEFTKGTPEENVVIVNGLGDKAYFNEANGMLNVLDGKNWILISYGPGSDPAANTLEDAAELAQKVIN